MARFVFQLEGVLRQRKHVERQRQRELAVVQARMTSLQAELRELNGQVQTAVLDLRENRLIGRLDMRFLAAHRRFISAMQDRGMSLVRQMAGVARHVEEAQKALADAAKQRKVMEKLRQRQYEGWLAEQNRKVTAELDEIGMQLSFHELRRGDGAESAAQAAKATA